MVETYSMAENLLNVRAKTVSPRRRINLSALMFVAGALLLAGAATLGFDAYYGKLGIIGPRFEIIQNGASRIIKVPPGGNLQAAIDRAVGGDVIQLQAGATYKGAFKLPNKPGNEFITIRTSAADAQLPSADMRLDPKKYAEFLPKIASNVKGEPAILAINGAHHYRFIGVEFGPTPEGLYNIIQLGTTEETAVEQMPHHIEFDRVALIGDLKWGQRRGIAANGKFIRIANSYFKGFKREGEESQAIAIWGTDGPVEIINNYLEAAAESILFGGAENAMHLVAADCLVRDNLMTKPIEWKGTNWVVKNFVEIKSGRRIKIENNLMTNNWLMAQEGTGVLFRTAEDSGKQAVVEDIEFTNNIMRGAGSAVNIFGGEGKGGRNLTIRNNIFEDISSKKYGGRGFFIKSTTFDNVVIENNTVIHDGSIAVAYGDPVSGMIFRNNIVFQNEYGFFGDGVGPGRAAIARYFPRAVLTNNIIVGGSASDYGPDNFYPSNAGQIGFADAASGDYRLRSGSIYLTKGFAGKAVGANLDPRTVGGR